MTGRNEVEPGHGSVAESQQAAGGALGALAAGGAELAAVNTDAIPEAVLLGVPLMPLLSRFELLNLM